MKHLWRKDKGYDSHWYLSDFLAAIVAFALFITLLWVALPADSKVNSDANQPDYWCEEGFKVEFTGDDREWVADGSYILVVIKAGTENYTFTDVKEGDVLTVPKGISHIIFCTTPQETTTTTTVPEETTTTLEETTTTVTEESSTTTTTTEAPTTTTTHSSTTTTETEATSTTTAIPTTTEPPILPSTTVGSMETSTELPFTGFDPRLLLVGILSVIGGTALLAKTHEPS